jgi:hypothetical protein
MKISIIAFLLSSAIALAGPSFQYDSARTWTEETVKTDIPKSKRIYLLGPELVTETYSLNGKATKHDVEMRRILSVDSATTVQNIWKQFQLDLKGTWILSVYRASHQIEPVYTTSKKEVFNSTFPLMARDVIWVRPFRSGVMP